MRNNNTTNKTNTTITQIIKLRNIRIQITITNNSTTQVRINGTRRNIIRIIRKIRTQQEET